MSYTGTITKLNEKGFGFIGTEDGNSVFFHASSLGEGQEGYDLFNSLEEGVSVTFDVTEGRDGKTKALNVSIN